MGIEGFRPRMRQEYGSFRRDYPQSDSGGERRCVTNAIAVWFSQLKQNLSSAGATPAGTPAPRRSEPVTGIHKVDHEVYEILRQPRNDAFGYNLRRIRLLKFT
jgi:hypothetical protein